MDWFDWSYFAVLAFAGMLALSHGVALCLPPPRLVGLETMIYPMYGLIALFAASNIPALWAAPWYFLLSVAFALFLGFIVWKVQGAFIGKVYVLNTTRRDLVPEVAELVTRSTGLPCHVAEGRPPYPSPERPAVIGYFDEASGLSLKLWDPPRREQVDAIKMGLRPLRAKSRMRDVPQVGVAMVAGCATVLVLMLLLLQATNWLRF